MVDTIASGETRDYFLGAGEVLHLYDAGNCRGTISRRNGASYEAICDLTPMTVGEPNGLAGPGGYRISLTAGSVTAVKSVPPAPGTSDGAAFSAGAFDSGSRAGLIRATDPTLPLNRLKTIFRAATGKAPIAPASPATITISAPVTTGSGTSQITNKVDHLFTTTDKFSVYDKANWYVITTSTNDYYVAPTSNTGVNSYATVGFRYEGSKFELMARAGDKWFIFADGAPVYTGVIAPAMVGGNGQVLRITVDFGSRAARNIVCYGQQRGFGGISIGPTDSIAPIDLTLPLKLALLADSYGYGLSSWCSLGPFGEMAMRLLGQDTFPCLSTSSDAGSGYVNVGIGGTIFSQRVPFITARSPDLVVVAGGFNDATATLAAAASGVLSAIRAALPNAVIATVGVWTPNTTYYGTGVTKHGLIYSALQGISGPWVDIDVPGGAWSNSAGASGRVGPAPWVTGTGNTGAPAGTGNADFNTSADTVHPSLAGNDYLGGHLYTGLRAGILAL